MLGLDGGGVGEVSVRIEFGICWVQICDGEVACIDLERDVFFDSDCLADRKIKQKDGSDTGVQKKT